MLRLGGCLARQRRELGGPTGRRWLSMRIEAVRARAVDDNVVEVTLSTAGGSFVATAAEPRASVAVDAVSAVLAPKLLGLDPTDQGGIDQLVCSLDGTKDRSDVTPGGVLAVSVALARAGAAAKQRPLFAHLAELAGRSEFQLPVPIFDTCGGNITVVPLNNEHLRDAVATHDKVLARLRHNEHGFGKAGEGEEAAPQNAQQEPNEPKSVKKQLALMLKVLADLDLMGHVGLGVKDAQSSSERLVQLCRANPIVFLQDPDVASDVEQLGLMMELLGESVNVAADREHGQEGVRRGIVNSCSIDLQSTTDSVGTVSEAVALAAELAASGPGVALLANTQVCAGTDVDYIASFCVSQPIAAVVVRSPKDPILASLAELELTLAKAKEGFPPT